MTMAEVNRAAVVLAVVEKRQLAAAFSTVFPPPLLRVGGIASVERPWKTLPGSFGGTASRGAPAGGSEARAREGQGDISALR